MRERSRTGRWDFRLDHNYYEPETALAPAEGTLIEVIDRVLDKGLVINADILVSVAGVELLGVRIRAALASFATAAKYGLEFPAGTDLSTQAWQEAAAGLDTCPQCQKTATKRELLDTGCPWCGWLSHRARTAQELRMPL